MHRHWGFGGPEFYGLGRTSYGHGRGDGEVVRKGTMFFHFEK